MVVAGVVKLPETVFMMLLFLHSGYFPTEDLGHPDIHFWLQNSMQREQVALRGKANEQVEFRPTWSLSFQVSILWTAEAGTGCFAWQLKKTLETGTG